MKNRTRTPTQRGLDTDAAVTDAAHRAHVDATHSRAGRIRASIVRPRFTIGGLAVAFIIGFAGGTSILTGVAVGVGIAALGFIVGCVRASVMHARMMERGE